MPIPYGPWDSTEGAPLDASAISPGRAKSATVNYPCIPGVTARSITTTQLTLGSARLYYEPRVLYADAVLDELWVEVTTAQAASTARVGFATANEDWQPEDIVYASATIDTSTTGIKKVTGIDEALPAGLYLAMITTSVDNLSFRVVSGEIPNMPLFDTLGANGLVQRLYVDRAYAALPDPPTAWNAVLQSSVGVNHFVFSVLSAP